MLSVKLFVLNFVHKKTVEEAKSEENAVEEKNEENAGEEKKEEIVIMHSTNDNSSRPGRTATTDRRSDGGSDNAFGSSPPPTATTNRRRNQRSDDNTNSAPSRGGTRKRRREETDAGDPTKQLQSRMASPPPHSRTSRRGSYTPSKTQIVMPEPQSPSKRQTTNNRNHNLNFNQQQSVSNACLFILVEFFPKDMDIAICQSIHQTQHSKMNDPSMIVFDLLKEDNLHSLHPYTLLLIITKKLPAVPGISIFLGPKQHKISKEMIVTSFRPGCLERDDAIVLMKSYIPSHSNELLEICIEALIGGLSDEDSFEIGCEMKKFVAKQSTMDELKRTMLDWITRLNL